MVVFKLFSYWLLIKWCNWKVRYFYLVPVEVMVAATNGHVSTWVVYIVVVVVVNVAAVVVVAVFYSVEVTWQSKSEMENEGDC